MMETGTFVIMLLLILLLGGGMAYFAYMWMELKRRIDSQPAEYTELKRKNAELEAKLEDKSEENKDTREKADQMKSFVLALKTLRRSMTSVLESPSSKTLVEILDILCEQKVYMRDDATAPASLQNLRSILISTHNKAAMLDLMKNNIVNPLRDELMIGMPNDERNRQLRFELISSLFKMIDCIQSVYQTSAGDYGLQIEVVRGDRDLEEALAETTGVTEKLSETDLWAQRLNVLLQSMDLKEGNLILKKYRFKTNRR